jgi:hypothetical protein
MEHHQRPQQHSESEEVKDLYYSEHPGGIADFDGDPAGIAPLKQGTQRDGK